MPPSANRNVLISGFLHGLDLIRARNHRFALARLIGLLFLAFPAGSLASTNSAWSIHNWRTSEGLPNNDLTGIAQTSDGFLWLATSSQTGLTRFDGVHFENIPLQRVMAAKYEKTTALAQSRSGGLWVGMDHGAVIYFNGVSAQFFTNGMPDESVLSLLEERQGAVWVVFRVGDICRIEKDKVTRFGSADGLPSVHSQTWLALDNQDRIWFAKSTHIGIYQDGRFKTIARLPWAAGGIAKATGGGVWVGSNGHLFHCDLNGKLDDCGAFASSPLHHPTPLLEDASHIVWIGTGENGLFCYNGSQFQSVPVSHHEIQSLLEDREGDLWVGTRGEGLSRVYPRTVELQGTESGLPSDPIQSLCQDENGRLWAIAQNGTVLCQTNGIWRTIDFPETMGEPSCIASGPGNSVWIGTLSGLLHCWRDGHWKTFSRSDGLAGRQIHSLLVTSSGDVWLGEEIPESVQHLGNGKFSTIEIPETQRVLRAIARDTAGNIWVGSSAGGLLRISGDQVDNETALTIGQPIAIRCLYSTPDGALWIGYAGGGVGWLKDAKYKRISTGVGLSDANISQILSDGRGWMWFGGDSGIFKARKRDLEDFAEGRAERVESVRCGQDLPALQANFGRSSDALRSRDGRLWMPMLTALAVIDPVDIRENETPANPLVERVLVDDILYAFYGGAVPVHGPVDLKSSGVKFRLPPGRHRLEFDFTALSFSAPGNVQFRYRLDGFDTRWIEAQSQHDAVYPQVAAGKYEFQVTACNCDGVWSGTVASISFSIAPFFWQTWWFRLAILALFTSAVVAVARYASHRRLRLRLAMLEQQDALNKERMRIAKDLHDDLGTRLTKIVLLSGLAQRDRVAPQKLEEHLKKLSTAAHQVISSLDETVWAVNPRNDTLPHLINYIGRFAVEFLKTAGIQCALDLPEAPPNSVVPAAVRHNLFLSVKEALNNIVRHANATAVHLRITATEELLELCIDDNGRGFEQASDIDGADGLRNMRQRIEEIGGRFTLDSRPDSGTKIVFTCPSNSQ
jgi:signal transduction histidine kinase/ligand-binding sensor domain-containing protein